MEPCAPSAASSATESGQKVSFSRTARRGSDSATSAGGIVEAKSLQGSSLAALATTRYIQSHAPHSPCTQKQLHPFCFTAPDPSAIRFYVTHFFSPSFVCTLHIDTFQTASTHLNSLNKKNPSGIKGRSILALYLRRNFKSTSRR